jgi:hypothetical protein
MFNFFIFLLLNSVQSKLTYPLRDSDELWCDLVHATDKTWYKVLYQHTNYVISLSNISIKTNFKQRVQLKFVQYCEGDYILYNTLREITFCD